MSKINDLHLINCVRGITGILIFLLASCSASSRDAARPGPGEVVSLQTTHGVQHARVFVDSTTVATPPLIVVLHGDAPHGPPDYQYAFAEELAQRLSGSVVAALLRPGYSDPTGLRSAGRKGFTTGDNYTPDQLDAIAQAIKELQAKYGAKEVFLVGHSGGAAIAANLMGWKAGLAENAALISCPCDLEPWRKQMSRGPGGLLWRLPTRSLSPLAVAEDIPIAAKIRLIVGFNDVITPPDLSRRYTEVLMQRDIDVKLTVLPDQGHEILTRKTVLDAVATLVEEKSNEKF